jgi:hypothetical protein
VTKEPVLALWNKPGRVRQRADQVLRETRPSANALNALKDAFVPALVRVDIDGEYTRRPAPPFRRCLSRRVKSARLLVMRQEADAPIVEVAHEALLRKWPLLQGWLDEERELLIGKGQLERDLREWHEAGCAREALLTGLKLTRANDWLLE